MNPAQSARIAKERHPSRFCKAPGCLWQLNPLDHKGWCPRHRPARIDERREWRRL